MRNKHMRHGIPPRARVTLRSVCISVGAVLAFLCCGAMPVSASTSIDQLGADIDGEAADDLSGWSVSLSSDGTILAIGARYNDGNGADSGHVRVYEWNDSTWDPKRCRHRRRSRRRPVGKIGVAVI